MCVCVYVCMCVCAYVRLVSLAMIWAEANGKLTKERATIKRNSDENKVVNTHLKYA